MNMDKKSISSVIEDINFYTIKCFDDNYDFQGEFEELDKIVICVKLIFYAPMQLMTLRYFCNGIEKREKVI